MTEKVVGLDGKPVSKQHGYATIISMLEEALERAKAGELSGAAMILVGIDGGVFTKAEHNGTRHDLVAGTVYLQHDLSCKEYE